MEKKIVAVGKGNTITVDNGWAQLDEANKADGHYVSKIPIDVRQTQEHLEFLQRQEIDLIDKITDGCIKQGLIYQQQHPAFPMLVLLQNEIFTTELKYNKMWDEWNKSFSEGTVIHISTITEKVPECEISAGLA